MVKCLSETRKAMGHTVIRIGPLGWSYKDSAGIACRNQNRHGIAPAVIGFIAATIILVGKFQFDSMRAMYAGFAGLIAASLWNSWPKLLSETCPGSAFENVGRFRATYPASYLRLFYLTRS